MDVFFLFLMWIFNLSVYDYACLLVRYEYVIEKLLYYGICFLGNTGLVRFDLIMYVNSDSVSYRLYRDLITKISVMSICLYMILCLIICQVGIV